VFGFDTVFSISSSLDNFASGLQRRFFLRGICQKSDTSKIPAANVSAAATKGNETPLKIGICCPAWTKSVGHADLRRMPAIFGYS
jgi:hypothetical protein